MDRRIDYNLLFDKHPQAMWIYEKNSYRFLAVNEAAIALYGYSREEFLRRTGKDIRTAEDVQRLLDYKFDLNGKDGNFEDAGLWRHRAKDGRILDVHVIWNIIDWNGAEAYLVCINDLTSKKALATEEKRAQQQIHEWKNRYESAVHASGQILYDWDCATNEVIYGGCYKKYSAIPKRSFEEAWINGKACCTRTIAGLLK